MQQAAVRTPIVSFIIRVREAEADSGMCGEVEHLGTGERRVFRDAASLTQLIEEWRREK
jgi:hypothetical protein